MPERVTTYHRFVVVQDLGLQDYHETMNLQTRLRSDKTMHPELPDQLLLVEHAPVFTFGKNGGRENLMVSEQFLADRNIETVQTDRGGNVTYHGPGQAVMYPIVDLNRAHIGVADFVHGLETVMQNVCSALGITAERNSRNHGLWVGEKKIGSIGLSIKKGISIHGLALNIDPDLTPFSWINPCGLENISVTSVQKELKPSGLKTANISMAAVKDSLVASFCQTFNFNILKEHAHV